MKKVFAALLAAAMCLFLCACGETPTVVPQDEETVPTDEAPVTEEEIKVTKLELGKQNAIADYAEFVVCYIRTTDKITPPVGDKPSYHNENTNETFVDVVLDWTNLSTADMKSDKIVSVTAVNGNGKEYYDGLCVIETDNGNRLSFREHIAPLETARLHCAVSVPENEQEITLKLAIGNEEFTFAYVVGEAVGNA